MKSTDTSTTSSLIDYAHPMMMAEHRLKDAHNCLLHGDPEGGIEHLFQVIAEARIAIQSVRHMQEMKR